MTGVPQPDALGAAAERLRDAMAAGVPCDPVRDIPGLEAAGPEAGYAVQGLNTEHWLGAGRRISGHKVGLTNPAVQAQLAMDEPIWGVLFADKCRTDGDDIGGAGLIEPRVEVEVAVVLGADLDKGQHTVADVISATAYVLPAFEIVDSRISGWDITNFDMIADNAGAGLYVLGTRPVPLAAVDLRRVEMQLTINRRGGRHRLGRSLPRQPVELGAVAGRHHEPARHPATGRRDHHDRLPMPHAPLAPATSCTPRSKAWAQCRPRLSARSKQLQIHISMVSCTVGVTAGAAQDARAGASPLATLSGKPSTGREEALRHLRIPL